MKHRRSAKELLVHFLKAKAELITKHSKIEYLNPMDYNEILGWSEEYCVEILQKIEKMINKWGFFSDPAMCPWCAVQGMEGDRACCKDCTYATRHMICFEEKSDYHKILDELRCEHYYSITQIPKMEKLCLHYFELFEKFLEGTENI